MQAPRLVASDIDGTLLGPDDLVSRRTVDAVARVIGSGVPFVLVTGRPARWVPMVAAQVPGVRFAICGNGALLYDAVEDRVVWARAMAPELLGRLAVEIEAALPECGIAVERSGGASGAELFLADDRYVHAWPDGERALADRATVTSEPATKMLVRCPERSSDAMMAVLVPLVGERADLTYSHPRGLVELSAPGVTKASGLASVAEEHGVAAADVVAFGDMPNDLEMIEWAGHGVAMGNAHPALLDVADEVTAGNGDDGLALVLERWF